MRPLAVGDRVKIVRPNDRKNGKVGTVGIIMDDGLVVVDFDDHHTSSLAYWPGYVRRLRR